MTDEQIIIDGVDVSKCIYFQQEDDEYTCGAEECNGAIVACRACDNCYYKQLKRKEQECEYLKKKLLRKEAVVEFASCPSYGYSDNTIEATCSKTFCYDVNSCEHKTMVNYEQTLIKLREIAEECMQQDICATCDNSDKCHIEDEEIPTYDVCKIILQKIDEVLYVENN